MKAICFDLDGTLIDSRKDIVAAVNKVLKSYDLKEVSLATGLNYVGKGAAYLLKSLLPANYHEHLEKSVELFLQFYDQDPVRDTLIYDGVLPFLQAHENMTFSIVTNKHKNLADKILKELGLAQYFERVVGGDSYPEMKPAPKALLDMMQSLSLSPKDVLMVGDTNVDMQFGINAGVKTCRFHSGFGAMGDQSLVPSDFEIHSIQELHALL